MKEIERRVSLTPEQSESIIAELTKQGAIWQQSKRFRIDYSHGVKDRTDTVNVRVTDGEIELAIKDGGIDKAIREESNVALSSPLSEVLKAMALLGYNSASVGIRKIQITKFNDIEFSIREARDKNDPEKIVGINMEVELLKEGSIEGIDSVLKELGLKAMNDEEANKLFQRFHDEADRRFNYSPESAKELEEICNKYMK